MKAEGYREQTIAVNGWQVRLVSYKLGEQFFCTADNLSPGGWLARAKGASRREAEQQALDKARKLLAPTHRQAS